MCFKELGGKCKFDYILDKRKMFFKFFLVEKRGKIENICIFKDGFVIVSFFYKMTYLLFNSVFSFYVLVCRE